MITKRKISAHKLTYIALTISLIVCGMVALTYSALTAQKSAVGTITFTGDLALCMSHGSSGDNSSLTLDLMADFESITSAENLSSPYLEGLTGQVVPLVWEDNASGGNNIVFSVYSDGNTSVYITFTIELTYKPASASNLPENAQDWLIYPVFGSDDYEMTYLEGQENGNIEYSYYSSSDGMVISYPEYEKTGTTVTKRFHCYYMDFTSADSTATMKSFAGTQSANYNNYKYLNKSVDFSDIISEIVFFLEGDLSPNDGDLFTLTIDCDVAIFPQM